MLHHGHLDCGQAGMEPNGCTLVLGCLVLYCNFLYYKFDVAECTALFDAY